MLVELMRPAGGAGAELARRWVAALLLAPEGEREGIVEEVEARMVELFGGGGRAAEAEAEAGGGETVLDISTEPVQREGFVERVTRTYSARRGEGGDPATRGRRAGG